MAVIFTESFGWSDTGSDYLNDKNYASSGGLGPSPANVVNGSVVPPWTNAWYASWGSGTRDLRQKINTYVTGSRRLIVGTRAIWNGGGFSLAIQDASFNDIMRVDNASGSSTFTLSQGSGHTPIGTFTEANSFNWLYLEVDFTESGTASARVTGTQVVSGSASQATDISYVTWSIYGSNSVWLADFYVIDPTAGSNTSFLGDVHIEARRPTGAGASAQWTPLANANWQEVNDTPHPDGDTSYVHTNILGQRDYYGQGNINEGAPTAVFAVGTWLVAKTAGAGAGGVKASISSSGTTADGALTVPPSASYGGASLYSDTDPHTGTAWTVGGVNAAQPGQALLAS